MTVPTVDQVARPQAWGYDASLGDLLVRIAASPSTPLEQATAPAAAPRFDTATGAEDITDETGTWYSLSQLDGGAGLDFLHQPGAPKLNRERRFWDSKGVDVFSAALGSVYEATLLHDVAIDQADADAEMNIARIDDRIFYRFGDDIKEYPSSALATAAGTDGMLTMGSRIFLRRTNSVTSHDPDDFVASSTTLTTSVFDEIWAVKSRILGSIDNVLYQSDTAGGASTVILLTLPEDETFIDVIDAGPAVLVLTSTGYVHALALDQSNALIPAGETRLVEEVPTKITESQGRIGLATAETTPAGGRIGRFYTATLDTAGLYTLSDLQLVAEFGDFGTTVDQSIIAMVPTRESIYFISREGNEHTVWRYFLPTGGYARDVTLASTVVPDSFVEVDDRFYFALPTSGIWKEQETYVALGYVIGAVADFLTSDLKQWTRARLVTTPVPALAEVRLFDTDEVDAISDPNSSDWRFVTQVTPAEQGGHVVYLSGRNSRYHAAKIELVASPDQTAAPSFRSFRFQAQPSPDRDRLFRIPINVSDQFESPGRRAMRSRKGRGLAVYQALLELEGDSLNVEIYRLGIVMKAIIEKVEEQISTISARGSITDVAYVQIRGRPLASGQSGLAIPGEGAPLGINMLGIGVMGRG